VAGGQGGEALKLRVSCNGDTEEGGGVIFRVYGEGADPERDRPVEEIGSENKGGKAGAEWTYRYKHDPENPLKEKPKYFFTANGVRCKEVKSGNVEIGMEIDIPVCFEDGESAEGLEWKLTGADGAEESGTTDSTGKIESVTMIPANYKITIFLSKKKLSKSKTNRVDLMSLDEEYIIIKTGEDGKDALFEFTPDRKYILVISSRINTSV
jgi:hypothetical protein